MSASDERRSDLLRLLFEQGEIPAEHVDEFFEFVDLDGADDDDKESAA